MESSGPPIYWEAIHGGVRKQHLPTALDFELQTKCRRKESVLYKTQVEQFWDTQYIGKLQCHERDEHEDLAGLAGPTFVYAVNFCPLPGDEHLLALADEEGVLMIQDTNRTCQESLLIDFEAHNNAIFDVAWRPHHRGHLATASGDQTVCVWEADAENREHVAALRRFRGYTRSVKCVEFNPGKPNVLASGSRENAIIFWDMNEPSETKPAMAIRGAHTHTSAGGASGMRSATKRRKSVKPSGGAEVGFTSSVTAVQFQDEHTLVSASDTDGLIKVWDLRRSYDLFKGNPIPKFTIPYPGNSSLHGYSSLVLNSAKTHVYASCKDNHIYLFDLASYSEKPLAAYSGYENGCKFFIKMSLSCDDKYLACGSSDNYAYIWNTSPYAPTKPIYRLDGQDNEVTCVDWSKTDWRLATCSDDMKHRIWRIQANNQADDNEIVGHADPMIDVDYPTAEDFKIDPKLASSSRSDSTMPSKENTSPNITEPASKRRRLLSPTASPSKRLAEFPAAGKMQNGSILARSPRKLFVMSNRKQPELFMSPTANLPNLVLDSLNSGGKGLSNSSSAKKRTTVDWLTSLSRQKKPKSPLVECSNKDNNHLKAATPSPARGRGRGPRKTRAKKSLNMSNV